jgi:hypothetical protein
MIRLAEIIESCKAEALAGRFSPSEVTDWRYFCREYSKTFHTPLHLVLEMAPEQVILAVLEDQLSRKNLNVTEELEQVIEEVRRLQDPNYDANAEKVMDDFVKFAEAQEAERIKRGDPIPGPKKKGMQKLQPEPEKPTQGFVDLSRFSTETEES